MLLTQISMKKKKKKTTSWVTSWSLPLWGILREKNTVAPALFPCLCRDRNPACPGALVLLSVLPSQACDRGVRLCCSVWAMSGECFPPAQPGTSHPLEEASISFLWPNAQGAPPPVTPPSGALVARASTSLPLGYLPEARLYPQSCTGVE